MFFKNTLYTVCLSNMLWLELFDRFNYSGSWTQGLEFCGFTTPLGFEYHFVLFCIFVISAFSGWVLSV